MSKRKTRGSDIWNNTPITINILNFNCDWNKNSKWRSSLIPSHWLSAEVIIREITEAQPWGKGCLTPVPANTRLKIKWPLTFREGQRGPRMSCLQALLLQGEMNRKIKVKTAYSRHLTQMSNRQQHRAFFVSLHLCKGTNTVPGSFYKL